MILGLFTRPMAFILSGEMAVAYFGTGRRGGSGKLPAPGMEASILFCFCICSSGRRAPGPGVSTASGGRRKFKDVEDRL